MNILVIDNYDSFTYNLVHLVEKYIKTKVTVEFNDRVALKAVEQYDRIILSPGPGIPAEAGISLKVIEHFGASKTILGVCLGHQAIAEAFGGQLYNYDQVHHGVASSVSLCKEISRPSRIFKGLPGNMEVARYHSWGVRHLPSCLEATAVDEEGNIMALQHKEYDIEGVQFHPESVLTTFGHQMIANWILR